MTCHHFLQITNEFPNLSYFISNKTIAVVNGRFILPAYYFKGSGFSRQAVKRLARAGFTKG